MKIKNKIKTFFLHKEEGKNMNLVVEQKIHFVLALAFSSKKTNLLFIYTLTKNVNVAQELKFHLSDLLDSILFIRCISAIKLYITCIE